MNCKYRKNLLDSAKKAINAQKTASNRGIQKTLWATSDLIRNKTADQKL